MTEPTIAALFVETAGCYFDLAGVDPWDQTRDARKYFGPHPIVAHPPCQRWGKLWAGHMGRRGIGFELKPSYFPQAARNIAELHAARTGDIFASNSA